MLGVDKIASLLKKGTSLRLYTPSDRPELSSNGGHYAYATKLIPCHDTDTVRTHGERVSVSGMVRVEYWNSSDFEYCQNCGRFDRNCNCQPEYLTIVEAVKRIRNDEEMVEYFSDKDDDWKML